MDYQATPNQMPSYLQQDFIRTDYLPQLVSRFKRDINGLPQRTNFMGGGLLIPLDTLQRVLTGERPGHVTGIQVSRGPAPEALIDVLGRYEQIIRREVPKPYQQEALEAVMATAPRIARNAQEAAVALHATLETI